MAWASRENRPDVLADIACKRRIRRNFELCRRIESATLRNDRSLHVLHSTCLRRHVLLTARSHDPAGRLVIARIITRFRGMRITCNYSTVGNRKFPYISGEQLVTDGRRLIVIPFVYSKRVRKINSRPTREIVQFFSPMQELASRWED